MAKFKIGDRIKIKDSEKGTIQSTYGDLLLEETFEVASIGQDKEIYVKYVNDSLPKPAGAGSSDQILFYTNEVESAGESAERRYVELGDEVKFKKKLVQHKDYGGVPVVGYMHEAAGKTAKVVAVNKESEFFQVDLPALDGYWFSVDMLLKSSVRTEGGSGKKSTLKTGLYKDSKKLPKKKIEKHEIIGQDHNKKMLEVAIERDYPVLLIGETGTGKTSVVREQAIERKAKWTRFNLTGETTVDEFVGKYELEGGKTVWRDGILLQAMKKGEWLIVDEINVALPEILFVLHSLLDDDKFVTVSNHAGEVVKPHKDFRFFATMNPVDEYAGTKELNKAFQSRFNMVLILEYPSNAVEAKIVKDKTGVEEAHANKMADVAVALRKAKEKDAIFYTCSTRDLIQWGNLVDKLGLEDAFIVSILNKANGDKKKIVEVYDEVVGKHIALEKKGYTLSVDWFDKAAQKLEEEKVKFDKNKETIRKEITAEIVKKLTGDEKMPESATVEMPEVEISL